MRDLTSSRDVRSKIELRMNLAFESDRAKQRATFEKESKRYRNAKEWREEAEDTEARLRSLFDSHEEYLSFRRLFNLMVHGEEQP